MSATRSIYKVLRSVLFSVILTAVGLVAALYVIISVPSVQNKLKNIAEKELATLTGGKIKIGDISIYPFNELRINNVLISDPDGNKCAYIGRLGAGIDLWDLMVDGDVVITYVELVSLDASLRQDYPGAPLNIQFLIDAFKSKEKRKQSKVRVVLHNIVVRKSAVSFRRTWMPQNETTSKFDPNNIKITNFNADLSLPYIIGDSVSVKLRRLAFQEQSGIDIKSLSLRASCSPHHIDLSDFKLKVGDSQIRLSDQVIEMNGYNDIINALSQNSRNVTLSCIPLYPADFKALAPILSKFNMPFMFYAKMDGTLDDFKFNNISVQSNSGDMRLDLNGEAIGVTNPKSIKAVLKHLNLHLSSEWMEILLTTSHKIPSNIRSVLYKLGNTDLILTGDVDLASYSAFADLKLQSEAGKLDIASELCRTGSSWSLSNINIATDGFAAGRISGVDKLGIVALNASGSLIIDKKDIDIDMSADVPLIEYNGNSINNLFLALSKSGKSVKGEVNIPDQNLNLTLNADILLDGANSNWNINGNIVNAVPSNWGIAAFKPGESISGLLTLNAIGNSVDNMQGDLNIKNAKLSSQKRPISIESLVLSASIDDNIREYILDSEFVQGRLTGDFKLSSMQNMLASMMHQCFPSLFKVVESNNYDNQFADIKLKLLPANELYNAFNIPIRPGEPVNIEAHVSGIEGAATLALDAKYLIQGKKKLIKNTHFETSVGIDSPLVLDLKTTYPVKRDLADIHIHAIAFDNKANANIGWTAASNSENHGSVALQASLSRDPIYNMLGIETKLDESSINLNGAKWKVLPATISFKDKVLEVNNIHISHDYQFININGKASANPLDVLTANLAGVDLQYIFDILNINHVDFGGIATGRAKVSNLFSGSPIAETENLTVKDLAYNGCVLGDGKLYGNWDNAAKKVGINADIQAADTASAIVRGGIFVTRDSLSFDFDAHKIDVRMLQPFMSGFTSKISGKASGQLKLYGNFSRIDLSGRAFADTITMKVDHTNVTYGGSDSIFFSKGLIDIPGVRLYDHYGNSGMFSGSVRHNYLKNATMDFELKDARKLLVFDTDAKINRTWNGRVFASGNAKLKGTPGLIALDVKMRTDRGTQFNIELDETRTATEYSFLTFSDKTAELEIAEKEEESFEEKFNKESKMLVHERPSIFSMDLAIDVNQDANLVLVMDPAAGDKIKASGNGALQMHYDTSNDDYTLYGKYTLERGTYNFSLQDLILKNFTIRTGSSITFNGDPLNGILDITASYRVNTNLNDLDASFKDDPDLKRTIVPVDALLKVNGDIHAPEIKFDLSLPTVTSEVERKLHSLISSEDMLNRQVIYLLALNRFYSPAYSEAEKGGEFASVASSTLSSQIQNIIGSMTDKISLAPSIKSEKSDFSDMEFDVALSSRLFDDRLLINGNLGYRDKSTSQTTFIGDFDVEYLLTRNGQLRLKAYNHFNDASYYLKSALTTQGIGIMYCKEFDDPLKFLKKNKNNKK